MRDLINVDNVVIGYEKTGMLDPISLKVECNQFWGVLGPNGSGKTTLLNVLCLKANYGELTGQIKLDNRNMDDKIFKEKCFHMEQYDSNWPYLKVRETCFFAAKLFGNDSSRTLRMTFVCPENVQTAMRMLRLDASGTKWRNTARICSDSSDAVPFHRPPVWTSIIV